MQCPECYYPMEIINIDDRERCYTAYHCPHCKKEFLKTTTYQTQSNLIEREKLEEIKE